MNVLQIYVNKHFSLNCRYINEKKMPNYSKTYGLYCILTSICLVMPTSGNMNNKKTVT